jgi:hypothetical protein
VDNQIQQRLKNVGMADEFGEDERKWMHDEALNQTSYTIAREF